ncbi:ATP-binding protein [Ferrimonas gelatinilytica]|uniref:histidine kinase n=1 Tax=Ferrimonas gelatinilytica TaxID=1255257 RepID=A0ABP9S165_9GAMM
MALLTLAAVALTAAQRSDDARTLYQQAANSVASQLPAISEELKQAGIQKADLKLLSDQNFPPGTILFAICSAGGELQFVSEKLKKLRLPGDCDTLTTIMDNDDFTRPLELLPERFFYIFPIPLQTETGVITIVMVRNAMKAKALLDKHNQLSNIQLLFILPIAFLLLTRSARWGIQPLQTMGKQLKEIKSGKRRRLGDPKAKELVAISAALNDLLQQGEQRNETYRNAMKDLAHSLKTRLAAVQAIMDDSASTEERRRSELYDQLSQMDQLIQYQLRKAVMGRQGLAQEAVDTRPIAEQLQQMLGKVYREKSLECQLDIDDSLKFPGSGADLMEFLGNLMENAYRFAEGQVRVSWHKYAEGRLRLSVEDDGPGIEPELRERVLRRGERADERHPGQGIGLAVCHEISLSYGGQLVIDDSPLGGTRITLHLPPMQDFSGAE